jgi:L-2-hydroxyglutarate oxidase LhgO
VEANATVGGETSSRNNEVIHAGFLYPLRSLKAALCRRGAYALYDYCEQRDVQHARTGKLLISTCDADTELLRQLYAQAGQHGVDDLRLIDGAEARTIEPQLRCEAALVSPLTGVVDTHGLMLALLADAQGAGGMIAYETRAVAVQAGDDSNIVLTSSAGGSYELACRTFINAAGLGARQIALSCLGDCVPMIDLAKGNFFAMQGPLPFRHIVVPVGDTLAMGGAFTIDSAGQGKFGPDLELVNHVDYSVDERRKSRFAAAIRRYYPDLKQECLRPDFAGIRPRLRTGDGSSPDWLVLGPAEHGISGMVHLLGFETPGVTACLAIGEHVANLISNPWSGHAALRHH